MSSSACLRQIVAILHTAEVEQRAYVCGVLQELASDPAQLPALVSAKAVAALLAVVQAQSALALKKPKAPKAKAGGDGKKDAAKKDAGPAKLPVNWSEVAVQNASGALHLLSFHDGVKAEIGRRGGIPPLLKLMSARNPAIYEHCVGALWNAGLDPANTALLAAARAPEFLVRPVPPGWVALDRPASDAPPGETPEPLQLPHLGPVTPTRAGATSAGAAPPPPLAAAPSAARPLAPAASSPAVAPHPPPPPHEASRPESTAPA